MFTDELTIWAERLTTNWSAAAARRYLVAGETRIGDTAVATVVAARLNGSIRHGVVTGAVTDGITVAAMYRTVAHITHHTGNASAATSWYVDVTDDTDTVIRTALGLIHDGVAISDAVATARALHP
jgi:hypothetical protein